jgi:general stress protein 26
MPAHNLAGPPAHRKIKELAEAIDFGMLCTDLSIQPFHAVPMSTKRVDEDGAIWFLSGGDSTHNANIARDGVSQLIYANPKAMQFLIIYGQSSIHTERTLLESLYSKTDDAWFRGVDDPNLTALKIVPLAAHYWDVKGNTLVALLQMGVAAMTGAKADVARHGNLMT